MCQVDCCHSYTTMMKEPACKYQPYSNCPQLALLHCFLECCVVEGIASFWFEKTIAFSATHRLSWPAQLWNEIQAPAVLPWIPVVSVSFAAPLTTWRIFIPWGVSMWGQLNFECPCCFCDHWPVVPLVLLAATCTTKSSHCCSSLWWQNAAYPWCKHSTKRVWSAISDAWIIY